MLPTKVLVSVCICTFRRPGGLEAAISSVAAQVLPAAVHIEVVVVDNDPNGSAHATIEKVAETWPTLSIRYFNEKTPGVSYARNRCLREAQGQWVAFIDDDESAVSGWLQHLHHTATLHKADAVFGPVLPVYETEPPSWLASTGAVSRARFKTGHRIQWPDARTGNVLISQHLAAAVGSFDDRFARTGGEDSLFFAHAQNKGFLLVWCDEAVIHESVPAQRMKKSWVLQRAFHGGRTYTRLRVALGGRAQYVKWFAHAVVSIAIFTLPCIVYWLLDSPRLVVYQRKLYGAAGKMVAAFYNRGEYGKTS